MIPRMETAPRALTRAIVLGVLAVGALPAKAAQASSPPAASASPAPPAPSPATSPAASPPASAPAPAPAAAQPAAAPRDFDAPPPLASEPDKAFWKVAYELNNDLVLEQHVAARLTHQAKAGRYDERLPAAVKAGQLPQARADELTRDLQVRWAKNVEVVQAQWPVSKVRGCRYELLNFEGVLHDPKAPGAEAQLKDAREQLSACVSRGTAVLRAVRGANEELRAAIAELDRALPPAPPAANAAAKAR